MKFILQFNETSVVFVIEGKISQHGTHNKRSNSRSLSMTNASIQTNYFIQIFKSINYIWQDFNFDYLFWWRSDQFKLWCFRALNKNI